LQPSYNRPAGRTGLALRQLSVGARFGLVPDRIDFEKVRFATDSLLEGAVYCELVYRPSGEVTGNPLPLKFAVF
jgi:hypothetical protein